MSPAFKTFAWFAGCVVAACYIVSLGVYAPAILVTMLIVAIFIMLADVKAFISGFNGYDDPELGEPDNEHS